MAVCLQSFSSDKKRLTTTLTVSRPPDVPNVLFYYYAKLTVDSGGVDEESMPVRLFKG